MKNRDFVLTWCFVAKPQQITAVGQQDTILHAIATLDGIYDFLKSSPVGSLGAELLQAGKGIDQQPYVAIAAMAEAITRYLSRMDARVPPKHLADYAAIRTELLGKTAEFTLATYDMLVSQAPASLALAAEAKVFIRTLLPLLQQLRSLLTTKDKISPELGSLVHVVTIQRENHASTGLSIRAAENGIIYIHGMESTGVAQKSGMLRLGDDILEMNGQSIVGWRLRSVANFLKENCSGPLRLALKLTAEQFDQRLAVLMEQVGLKHRNKRGREKEECEKVKRGERREIKKE